MSLPLPLLLDLAEGLMTQDNLIAFCAAGLIFYIAALILSKTTKCIIIWRWWDLIILAIPGIIFLAAFYFNHSENKNAEFIRNIALNILFVFSFLVTIVVSVVANIKYSGPLKSIIYIVVAFLTKIFVAILIPVFIVLFFAALNSGNKDKRYKYAKKDNKNIIMAGIIAATAALLVGSLIKTGNNQE